jgi:hypothetical protein
MIHEQIRGDFVCQIHPSLLGEKIAQNDGQAKASQW